MQLYTIVILKADRLQADLLRQIVSSVIPNARCSVASKIEQARAMLEHPVDLLVTGIGSFDEDVLELIALSTRNPRRARAILVVTGSADARTLACLHRLPVSGVFDSSAEGSDQLRVALQTVLSGASYWSRSALELIRKDCNGSRAIGRLLTANELRVFAVIGDGRDDASAASELGLKASTVSSIRREIHRKLRIAYRGELIRLALLSGYVRFVRDKAIRPGYSMLVEACRVSKFLPPPRGRLSQLEPAGIGPASSEFGLGQKSEAAVFM
jgi:DNA-binding NarL/FixJ family response regulator